MRKLRSLVIRKLSRISAGFIDEPLALSDDDLE